MILIKLSPDPQAIQTYAHKYSYEAVEFSGDTLNPNLAGLIYSCVEEARRERCIEVAIAKIRSRYDIHSDEHSWALTIIGFRKPNN